MIRSYLILFFGMLLTACSSVSPLEEISTPEAELPYHGSESDTCTYNSEDPYFLEWVTPTTWIDSRKECIFNDMTRGASSPSHYLGVETSNGATVINFVGVPFSRDSVSLEVSDEGNQVIILLGKANFRYAEGNIESMYGITSQKHIFSDFSLELPEIQSDQKELILRYSFLPEFGYLGEKLDFIEDSIKLSLFPGQGASIFDLPFATFEYRKYLVTFPNLRSISIDGFWASCGTAYNTSICQDGIYGKCGVIVDSFEEWPNGPRHAVDFTLMGDTLTIEIEGWKDHGARSGIGIVQNLSADVNTIELMVQYGCDLTELGMMRVSSFLEDFPKRSAHFPIYVRIGGKTGGRYHFILRSLINANRIWEGDVNLVEGETVTVHFDTHDPSSGTTSGIDPIYY